MLKTSEIEKIFGKPGDDRNLITVPMPYPRKIAWDLKTITNRMQCHKLVAPIFQKIHSEILSEKDYQKFKGSKLMFLAVVTTLERCEGATIGADIVGALQRI